MFGCWSGEAGSDVPNGQYLGLWRRAKTSLQQVETGTQAGYRSVGIRWADSAARSGGHWVDVKPGGLAVHGGAVRGEGAVGLLYVSIIEWVIGI